MKKKILFLLLLINLNSCLGLPGFANYHSQKSLDLNLATKAVIGFLQAYNSIK